MPDSSGRECYECQERFTAFRRRHHCRLCGQIFCSKCCGVQVSGSLLGLLELFSLFQNNIAFLSDLVNIENTSVQEKISNFHLVVYPSNQADMGFLKVTCRSVFKLFVFISG